jgi:hypothetical protein
MSDLQPMLQRLAARVPFTYVHFNDGELNSMGARRGSTARGLQRRSPALATALGRSLQTDAHGLILGVPCRLEFPSLHASAMRLVANSSRTRVTAATLFVNGNHATARDLLPRILRAINAPIHLVVSAAANVTRFTSCTSLTLTRVLRMPPRDAYPHGLAQHRDAWRDVNAGDVVLICAGPVGRLLAVEWHAHLPAATILELGSFFDPDLTPTSFFGAVRGPRYYQRQQCGQDVSLLDERRRRRAFAAAPACQRRSDVRARVDEKAIWAHVNDAATCATH